MQTRLNRLPVILALCLIMPLLAATEAEAQLKADVSLLTFNVGWTSAKTDFTTDQANGTSLSFMLDRLGLTDRVSLGLSAAVLNQHEDFFSGGEERRVSIRAVPVMLSAKFWLGDVDARTHAYVGLGIGVHTSSAEIVTRMAADPNYAGDRTSGGALGVPVGVTFWATESLFLNANYQFMALGKSFYDKNVAHMFAFGIGVEVGG